MHVMAAARGESNCLVFSQAFGDDRGPFKKPWADHGMGQQSDIYIYIHPKSYELC